jgi:cytochrome oxidase Cu insertion factor (SCO1/SenC/PrrC family)
MDRPQSSGAPRPKEKYWKGSWWIPWAMAIPVLLAPVRQPIGDETAFGASASSEAPIVGSPAPDFKLRLLDGKSVTLSSLKGKPVVVNFWHSA